MFNSKVWRQHRVKRQKAPSHQPPHHNWHGHGLRSCSVPSAARNSPDGTTSLRNLIHAQQMPEGGRFSSPWDTHLTHPGSTKLPWRPDIPAWGPQPRALPKANSRMRGCWWRGALSPKIDPSFYLPGFHTLRFTRQGQAMRGQGCSGIPLISCLIALLLHITLIL